MAVEQVAIEWVAKLDKLKAELAKIPDIGGKEAKALVAGLEREMKAAEKAARDTGKAAEKSKGQVKGFGDAAGGAGAAAAKLRGFLGMLSPELANVAGLGNDVGDAFEVAGGTGLALTGPLALLAGAALAGGAAYAVLTHDLNEANAKQERAAELVRTVQPLYLEVEGAVRAAAVATGEMTQAEADDIATQEKWQGSANATIAKLREMRAAMTKELEPGILDTSAAFFGVKDDIDALAHSVSESLGPVAFLAYAWDQDAQKSKKLANEAKQLDAQIVSVGKAAEHGAEADIKAAHAKEAHKAAADTLKSMLSELNAEMDAENALAERNAATYQGVLASLGKSEEASRRAMMSAEERAAAEHEAAQATLQAERDKALAVASGVSAREEAERAYRAASAAENQAYQAEQVKAWDDNLAKIDALYADSERMKREEITATRTALLSSTAALAGDVSEAFAAQSEAVAGRSKAEAMRWFRASKGASAAAALVNTYQGATAALASAPPPANLALAGITVAQGLLQVRKIANTEPSFGDTPGPMKMQGGGSVRLAAGDYFAAAQNPTDLQRQVGAPAAGPSKVFVQLRHEVFDGSVRQSFRQRGAVLETFLDTDGADT